MTLSRRAAIGQLSLMTASVPAMVHARAAPSPTRADPAGPKMNHRRWSTRHIVYKTDDPSRTEFARELHSVTIQPDGARTIRTLSEWDDVQTMKDVTVSLSETLEPVTAAVQFFEKQVFQGSAWYHFDAETASCEGWSLPLGRFRQSFDLNGDRAILHYQTLYDDALQFDQLRRQRLGQSVKADPRGTRSFLAAHGLAGTSAPSLIPVPSSSYPKSFIGRERVVVPAGTFDAEHFRYVFIKNGDPIDYWLLGDDLVPLQCITHGKCWALTDIDGDFR